MTKTIQIVVIVFITPTRIRRKVYYHLPYNIAHSSAYHTHLRYNLSIKLPYGRSRIRIVSSNPNRIEQIYTKIDPCQLGALIGVFQLCRTPHLH